MRLIITNGDCAAEKLRAAGITDEVLCWRDVLHEGPVPGERPLEDLSAVRAAFIANDLGSSEEAVRASFAERDAMIRRHAEFDRVELWFEHDLYDQLQLAQILSFFADEARLNGLSLVQADDYLGQQSPEGIRRLAEAGRQVTPEQLALGRQTWRIFASAAPWEFVQLLELDTSALPFLAPALRRLLAEYPDPVRGLGLTETRIVERLSAGAATAGEVFDDVAGQDDARFLGDTSVFRKIDGLAFAREPLLQGLATRMPSPDAREELQDYARTEVTLTPLGAEVLAGRVDHSVANNVDRWIGGTHLTPVTLIRYDRAQNKLFPVY